MGRMQDPSDAKMNGKQRLQNDGSDARMSSKRRRTGHENEKSSRESSPRSGADATPMKDRRTWTQVEEVALVKALLEHKREGRVIPLQSKTATYWTELITLLYPGEKGVTQRRIYDKVRRMHQKYNQTKQLVQELKEPWKNKHERALFDFWGKIFVDQTSGDKTLQGPEARVVKVSNGNLVKVLQVSDSSSEEEEEVDHEEERVATANTAPKAIPPVQASSGSEEDEDEDEEEDEDEDDSSPEKRRSVHSGRNASQVEATRIPQELRKTASLSRDHNHKTGVTLDSKQSGGNERKETMAVKDPLHTAESGERRPKGGADQSVLDADFVKSLKAELFEYVQNLRNDCMRELDEVKSLLTNPARVQMARRRQELILEELSLQEKELEINRRYCRLQKDALKLQPAC